MDVPTFVGQQGFARYTANGGTLYVYFTTDVGLTWSAPRPVPHYPGNHAIVNAADGWSVDSNGIEYRTVDGGNSWHASGLGKALPYTVRSHDGGVSWSFVKVPSS